MNKMEHIHIFPNIDDVMDFMYNHEDIATVLHKKPWGGNTNYPEMEVVLRYPDRNSKKVSDTIAEYFKNKKTA